MIFFQTAWKKANFDLKPLLRLALVAQNLHTKEI